MPEWLLRFLDIHKAKLTFTLSCVLGLLAALVLFGIYCNCVKSIVLWQYSCIISKL